MLLVLVMRLTKVLDADGPVNRPLALLGLCLAALFLVRPQQAAIGAFLMPRFVRLARSRPTASWATGAVLGGAACALAVAAAVGVNYSQFGVVSSSGYAVGGEGFHFLRPQLGLVLLGKSRGLLYFSPVVGLAAVGYLLFPRTVPRYAWPAVGNAVAQVYLIAAWSSPEQGDSFGARMWSDNAAAVAVGLALLFHRSPTPARWLIVGVALGTVGWTGALLARYLGVVH